MVLHDVTMWSLGVLLFALVLVSMFYAYSEVETQLIDVFGVGSGATAYMQSITEIWSWVDYFPIISYVSFFMGAIVTSWYSKTHPVFFVFYMVGVYLLVFVMYIYSNVVIEFTEALPTFSAIFDLFPYTKTFVENMGTYTLITATVIGIVQYSKLDTGGLGIGRRW